MAKRPKRAARGGRIYLSDGTTIEYASIIQRLGNHITGFVESLTNAVKIINTDHAYIHDKIGFIASFDIGDLTAAATESYSIKTPAGKYLHLKNVKLSGIGASVKASIIRGTTANPLTINSAGGDASELTGPHNANDNGDNPTGVTIKKTPTYTGAEDGETWDFVAIPGSSTNQFQSTADAKLGENFEVVLKPDTYYVITLTNLSAGGGDAASDVLLRMFWYEEDEG